jgi:hypothetical protein
VVAALLRLAGLFWLDSLALLLSAPWVTAIAWVVVRLGLDVAIPGDAETLPSAAELARRRLAR